MTQESSFELQNFLPYLLNQAAEEASRSFAQVYKSRYGMLQAEWRVLVHLGQLGQMTAGEICEQSKAHKTKISRAVHALEKRRWLKREQDQKDRRSEPLQLTQAGHQVYIDMCQVAEQHNQALVARLGPKLAGQLQKALQQIGNDKP